MALSLLLSFGDSWAKRLRTTRNSCRYLKERIIKAIHELRLSLNEARDEPSKRYDSAAREMHRMLVLRRLTSEFIGCRRQSAAMTG